jgi:superkiller protein 3
MSIMPGLSNPTADAAGLLAQAEELARAGEYDKALDAFDAVMRTSPAQPRAWEGKTWTLLKLDRAEDALGVIDTALEKFGDKPDFLRVKAQLHVVKGEPASAREAFDRLIAVEPQGADGWLGKSWALLIEGHPEQALECAERAIALNGELADGHSLRGESLMNLKRWAEAFAAYADAAKADPSQFGASQWAAAGDRFLQGGQLDLALQTYERAIAQESQNPAGWYGRGRALEQRGDFDGAVAAFERSFEIDKQFAAGLLDAGVLCSRHGDSKRAISFFRRAQEAQPDDPRPWIGIGAVQAQLGRHKEARAAYEQATALDPSGAETWNALGNSQAKLKQFDEALQSYERASEIEPNYTWAHYNRAFVLWTQKRWDEAMQAIDRAIEIEPNTGEFWLLKLGVLDDRSGREAAEIDVTFDQALQVISPDANFRLYGAQLLADNDRLDRARDLLHDVEASTFEDQDDQIELAECLLKIGENVKADDLLRAIDPTRLSEYRPMIWSFLRLFANRLAGAPQLSERLLVDFLGEFGRRARWIDAKNMEWRFKGVRRLLARSGLPVRDKLVLATLMDVQDANVPYHKLSFFTQMWAGSPSPP